MHPITAAIAAELLVVVAIFFGAVVLVNAGQIANFFQQWVG